MFSYGIDTFLGNELITLKRIEPSSRINRKLIPNERRFIGNFSFYTFELTFRKISPPSSEFKWSMNEALIIETRRKIVKC